jgi:hypothetical protein
VKVAKSNFNSVGSRMVADSQSYLASHGDDESFGLRMFTWLKDIEDETEQRDTLNIINARYPGDRAKINFAVLAIRLMPNKKRRPFSKVFDRIDKIRDKSIKFSIAPFSRGWYPGYLMSSLAEGQNLEFGYLQYDRFEWFSVAYHLPPFDFDRDYGKIERIRFSGGASFANNIVFALGYGSNEEKELGRSYFAKNAVRIIKIALHKFDTREVEKAVESFLPFEKRVADFMCSLQFNDTERYMGEPANFGVRFTIWAQPKSLLSRLLGRS